MSRLRILSLTSLLAAFLFASAFAQDKKDPPKETKKEEAKKEEPKKEAPKEEPKKEAPKKEAPKEEPKKEAPKTEPPKTETPKTEPLPFAWTFKLNESFYQEMTTETVQNIKVQGLDVNQTQKQTFYFKWTPIKQEGDSWQIKQTIEGLKMTIDIAGNPVTFDSTVDVPAGTAPAASPLSEFFKGIKGTEFTLTLNSKTMKVTKIEGREAFLQKLTSTNPQMKELLSKILSDDALKQMADPTFGIAPEKPLGKDNAWEQKSTLNLGPLGTYENTYKYTLKGKEGDLANITVDVSMHYKAPTDADPNLPFKIKSADLKTKPEKDKPEGKIVFNTKLGRIESSTLKLKINGTLVIEIGGTSTNVELTQDQTTTVKTSDKSLIPEKPSIPTPPKTP